MILASSFFDHVLDTRHWHIFESIDFGFEVPAPFSMLIILQLIAAGLIAFFYIRLARKVRVTGTAPRLVVEFARSPAHVYPQRGG